MATTISPAALQTLLAPLLPALAAAAVSHEPATGVLPYLSPILRQRVQFLAVSSTEPWLKLLCYDAACAPKLSEVALGGSLEPHPVSGEVEVDWEYDIEVRYRRVDEETLQALVVLKELGVAFRLVFCVNDAEGGGDGWRVGEVMPADAPSASSFDGAASLAEAESLHEQTQANKSTPNPNAAKSTNGIVDEDDEDDDDGYWGRYDATPARTPALNKSPAPGINGSGPVEDDYYARYDDVQPAMDNHDPDEAPSPSINQQQQQPSQPQPAPAPPLGLALADSTSSTQGSWTAIPAPFEDDSPSSTARRTAAGLLHPRPDSSASSNGSNTVARLEATAGKQEQSEFGVKQHVSRSVRSLWQLSRGAGIEREEFERLVRTELELISMTGD